ncbi:hypothetical protein LGH70_11765 [Hymenobacter sp. BT635]|uniref:Uncharacterized protein n=1 Tax=Hymenobacter nitidus TaxID=2880929 RepID=A0ABS8ACY8_9BACT|nr:hypothetical protein [Hymenobacter nitidus]MCB2378265.1 hypothetical protein [Hymenobacter nitidus]
MSRPPTAFSRLIALLGKVLNVVMLVVCGGATIWAGQLYLARRALPYTGAGTYFNANNGVTYDAQLVGVALGLAVLFGLLTLLLLLSAYRLYARPSRHRTR